MNITYKTHFLLGLKHYGNTFEPVHVWPYAPSQEEVDKALLGAAKSYDTFVLVSPVGSALPGNWESCNVPDPYSGIC